jgi:ATP-binding cassette, subfamily F, member 3
MPLLTVSNLDKLYGAQQVLDGVSFALERGERVALVGANGSGKSTLLRIIAGLDEADDGQVSLTRNALVTYVSQHARFESDHTLWEAMLEVFAAARQAQARMRELERKMVAEPSSQTLRDEYHQLSAIAEHSGYAYESRIERVLTGLELAPEQWHEPVSVLSGGQKTRANLARALLQESDLLLLDEPTNHLDIAAIQWLETFLKGLHQTFVVVAHDRYFLESVSRRTLEMTRGKIEDYAASYVGFLKLRDERRSRASVEYQRQQEHIAATEEFVRRFGAGQRSKEAQGRQKQLDRIQRIERPREEQKLRLRMEQTRRKGDSVLRIDDLSVGYDGRVIVRGPDELAVRPGARVAIVGPNGAGKTTLARTLIGQLVPVTGRFEWAQGATPAYYAQATSTIFSPGQTVLEAFASRFTVSEESARTYLGQFLFIGDEVYKDVGDLSGGERSRLALAVLLHSHPNVMLLDEPTNHLDISAREALERALKGFGGTVMLISHDRFLIDQLATEIWSIQDGKIEVFDGGWSDFEAGRFRRTLIYSPVPDPSIIPGPAPPVAIAGTRARRSRLQVSAEMSSIQEAADTLTAQLIARAATAPVDQLEQLTDEYAGLHKQLVDLTQELAVSR